MTYTTAAKTMASISPMTVPSAAVAAGPLVELDASAHPQVAGALDKYRAYGTQEMGDGRRAVDSALLREGVKHALDTISGDVRTHEEQRTFVRHAWGKYRALQRQRAQDMALARQRRGYEDAIRQINYADIEETPPDFDTVLEKMRQCGSWWSVVASENRRIASEKRRRKERDLINSKFGHLPEEERIGAYNAWKSENERLSSLNVRETSDAHKRDFIKWLDENPDFFDIGECDAQNRGECIVPSYRPEMKSNEPMRVQANADTMFEALRKAIHVVGHEPAHLRVQLRWDPDTERGPREVNYSTTHGRLIVHRTDRLVSGHICDVLGVVGENGIILRQNGQLHKRLPDQFYKQFHAYVQEQGLAKTGTFHRVYEVPPKMILSVHLSTATKTLRITQSLRTHIERPLTLHYIETKWRANPAIERTKEDLRKQLAAAKVSDKAPAKDDDIVGKLTRLKLMHDDGTLSKREFDTAKARLLQ